MENTSNSQKAQILVEALPHIQKYNGQKVVIKFGGSAMKDEDIKKYYYHNVSHHLGLDTHDISIRERPLENGNVITVEPGLYFANFKIGIRIEDDILFKDGKAVVLSHTIPKEIADIERLMNSR